MKNLLRAKGPLWVALAKKLNRWQIRLAMRRAGLPEADIKRLEYDAEQNQTTIVAEHPAVMDLAAALVSFFDSRGATNFVEMSIGTTRGLFTVTIKPDSGKSPAGIIDELQERITELEHDRRRLDWIENEWKQAPDNVGPACAASREVYFGGSIREVVDEWIQEDEILQSEPADA